MDLHGRKGRRRRWQSEPVSSLDTCACPSGRSWAARRRRRQRRARLTCGARGRIRKTWLEGTPIASIGEAADLSYPVEHLGEGAAALAGLLKGEPVLERLQAAERPAIIVGPGMLARPDRAAVLQQARLPDGPSPRVRASA